MRLPRLVVAALAMAALPAVALAQRDTLVRVGDHRLDVVRAGAGRPAVVFEAGLGDALDDWQKIWPAVARRTTAVAYSRAGLGRSENGASRHTAREEVDDLHALVRALGLRTPFVLVGRSYGGLLVRLYTSLYPADVAGLVLVDGTHEQQVKRWGEIDPAYPEQFRVFFDSVLAAHPAGADADETRETMRIQAAGTAEGLAPLPDIPIAVLTSMRSDPAGRYVNVTPRGHVAWRAMHDEWFRRSSNGIHVETSRAGHAIQDDEPQLVIDAIGFVLDRVSFATPAPSQPMPPVASLPIDHVILGIDSLDRGIALLEQATGVRAVFGGAHPGRGTQNALLSLGDGRYLELMAPNPADTTASARQARSIYAHDFAAARTPTPYGWAIHVPDADAERARLVARGLPVGGVEPGSRARPDGSVLHWKTLDPWGPAAAARGDVLPFVIAWGAGSAHPSTTTPAGCTLAELAVVSPQPEAVRALFAKAGWPVVVRAGEREHLEVVLDCPRGRVTFP